MIVLVLKYHNSFIIVGIRDRGWKGIKFCLMYNDSSWRQDMGIAILVARTALTLTLLFLRQVIMIMSVSPLPCNIVCLTITVPLIVDGRYMSLFINFSPSVNFSFKVHALWDSFFFIRSLRCFVEDKVRHWKWRYIDFMDKLFMLLVYLNYFGIMLAYPPDHHVQCVVGTR